MSTQSKKRYSIFFFVPGSTRYRIAEYDCDFVPPAYQVGDLFDARNVGKDNLGDYGTRFRIVAVEHQVIPDISDEHRADRFFVGLYLEALSEEEYDEARQAR